MTKSEYQDLVEFLGPKFDAISRQFEAIDGRFDAIDRRFDAIEQRLTRVEVTVEENRHHIQILAERIGALDSKMDRGFQAQAELIEGLDIRMGRWEGRSA